MTLPVHAVSDVQCGSRYFKKWEKKSSRSFPVGQNGGLSPLGMAAKGATWGVSWVAGTGCRGRIGISVQITATDK